MKGMIQFGIVLLLLAGIVLFLPLVPSASVYSSDFSIPCTYSGCELSASCPSEYPRLIGCSVPGDCTCRKFYGCSVDTSTLANKCSAGMTPVYSCDGAGTLQYNCNSPTLQQPPAPTPLTTTAKSPAPLTTTTTSTPPTPTITSAVTASPGKISIGQAIWEWLSGLFGGLF